MSATSEVVQISCKISNLKGLHARAAAQIVSVSNQYHCQLTLSHKNKSAPCLSLIKLLTLDAPKGSQVEIIAKGLDANPAAQAIHGLIVGGFGELEGH